MMERKGRKYKKKKYNNESIRKGQLYGKGYYSRNAKWSDTNIDGLFCGCYQKGISVKKGIGFPHRQKGGGGRGRQKGLSLESNQ